MFPPGTWQLNLIGTRKPVCVGRDVSLTDKALGRSGRFNGESSPSEELHVDPTRIFLFCPPSVYPPIHGWMHTQNQPSKNSILGHYPNLTRVSRELPPVGLRRGPSGSSGSLRLSSTSKYRTCSLLFYTSKAIRWNPCWTTHNGPMDSVVGYSNCHDKAAPLANGDGNKSTSWSSDKWQAFNGAFRT